MVRFYNREDLFYGRACTISRSVIIHAVFGFFLFFCFMFFKFWREGLDCRFVGRYRHFIILWSSLTSKHVVDNRKGYTACFLLFEIKFNLKILIKNKI